MKSIDDFLICIMRDEELKTSILKSKEVFKDYNPRKPCRSESWLALKNFWASYEGIKFRLLVERKLEMNLGSSSEVSRLKTALQIYIADVRDREGKRH